jgi:hypothetical protein
MAFCVLRLIWRDLIFGVLMFILPITVTARSNAWTVFAGSNIGIVDSNRTWGTDVCVYCMFVLSCVGSGLALGWSPVQGVLRTKIRRLKLDRMFIVRWHWRMKDMFLSAPYEQILFNTSDASGMHFHPSVRPSIHTGRPPCQKPLSRMQRGSKPVNWSKFRIL